MKADVACKRSSIPAWRLQQPENQREPSVTKTDSWAYVRSCSHYNNTKASLCTNYYSSTRTQDRGEYSRRKGKKGTCNNICLYLSTIEKHKPPRSHQSLLKIRCFTSQSSWSYLRRGMPKKFFKRPWVRKRVLGRKLKHNLIQNLQDGEVNREPLWGRLVWPKSAKPPLNWRHLGRASVLGQIRFSK